MVALAALVASVLVAGAWSTHVYWRREPPVARRGLLALLRALTLGSLALLVLLPDLPATLNGRTSLTWRVLDRSESMSVGTAADGTTPWQQGLDAIQGSGAESRAPRTFPLGAAPLAGPAAGPTAGPSAAPSPGPTASSSELAPVVRRAIEAGVRRLVVHSDARVPDGAEALALARAAGLELEVVALTSTLRSAGVAAVRAPDWVRAGEPVALEVELFATEGAADQVAEVRLELGDVEVLRREVRLPPPGVPLRLRLDAQAPDEAGTVVWRARVTLAGDEFPADDTRHAVTAIDEPEGALALISLQPDWEPRVLLDELATATGLPAVGWLRVGPDLWLEMGGQGTVPTREVLRRLANARLVVVHGLDAELPDDLAAAVLQVRRRFVLAHGPAGLQALLDVEARKLPAGEWYPDLDTPSAFGARLEQLDRVTLPPVSGALAVAAGPESVVGLHLRAPGAAEPQPGMLLLDQAPEHRTVLVTAQDFWRWHARPGAARDAYRLLMSGAAGWLLELPDRTGEGAPGPRPRVVAPHDSIQWYGSPQGPVDWRVEWGEGDDSAAPAHRTDTLRLGPAGRAALPPLPAGTWRWTARPLAVATEAADAASVAGAEPAPDPADPADSPPALDAAGVFVVEAATADLRWPADEQLIAGYTPSAAEHRAAAASPQAPLRTRAWPWLVILLLISTEWILRRRAGLR